MKQIYLVFFILILTSCTYVRDQNKINTNTPISNEVTSPTNIVNSNNMDLSPTSTISAEGLNIKDNSLIWHPSGTVEVPILLYHHVFIGKPTNAYAVSLDQFREQLDYLQKNGFQTISVSLLAQAITKGAYLPEKPIVITFDDGNENVFLNAFPLMKQFGFVGTLYIIADRVNADGFLTENQIKEMQINGWEIGNHSMTHADLVAHPDLLRNEVGNSKYNLETITGTSILSFAYPFGKANGVTKDWIKKLGYSAGIGLGITNTQSIQSLFYLSRREVNSQMDISDFEKLLTNN